MEYKYCTATNWGKNFFTHKERRQFYLSGHAGEGKSCVWVVGNNIHGDHWISKVSGVSKTKEEAQAIVTTQIEAEQIAYDALPVEAQAKYPRPVEFEIL